MVRSVQDMPLFWKLLIPFLSLILVLGIVGGFLIVRDLSTRSQLALDQELLVRSLDAKSLVHDRELYLLESANFGANLQGMAADIKGRDLRAVTTSLQSLLALKADLSLVAATDVSGAGLVEFVRPASGGDITHRSGTRWSDVSFIDQALRGASGEKVAGFLTVDDMPMLAIIAPICSDPQSCAPVGGAVVGFRLDLLVAEAHRKTKAAEISLYDSQGRPLATTGDSDRKARSPAAEIVRRVEGTGSSEVATLYAPLEVQGRAQGTIAVSLLTEPAFASVRGARFRLSLLLLLGMAGIVGIGALMSRFILGQVRPLMETNRALGEGDLSARAPVLANDELGELARGVNKMADQLQASHETLELRVAQRTEEVQRLLRERTDLFAALSHEFRTPLAVITRYVEMMIDHSYPKKPQWTAEAGIVIKDSTDQLLFLINDILALAKAEAGHLDVLLEDLALADYFKGLRKPIEGLTSGAGLSVKFDIPRQLPVVRADRVRLREIVLNLVDNAVKYTPAGHVEISARERDDRVEISVSDTGVGIPEQAKDRIFEPFYRVEGTKLRKGQLSTGLGLALTKRLIEAQGGKIWFEERQGGGTTFTFTLVPVAAQVTAIAHRRRNARRSVNPIASRLERRERADDRPRSARAQVS